MRVGVVGCAGRMGQMLVRTILETPGCTLIGGTVEPGSPLAGKDIGTLAGLEPVGVQATNDPVSLFAQAQAVLDFTMPAATVHHAALAAQGKAVHVVGTTGLSAEDMAAIERAARHTAIVQSFNMSLGVNLLAALVEQAAERLGPDFDIEIVEMHHRHKVDAPSGTALLLGKAAAAGRDVDLDAVSTRVRDGYTGPRTPGGIGFATLRGGDVVGDHTVIFAGEGERLELSHKASGRHIFAKGAVRAALWAQGRSPGLYSMRDVLGLS